MTSQQRYYMYRIFDVIYERRTLLGISYFLAYNKPSNAIQIGLLEMNSETNNQRGNLTIFQTDIQNSELKF